MTTKIIDQATLATVIQAYQQGVSLRELSTSLNEMGFTGPLGGAIHPYSLAIELSKHGIKIRSNKRPEDIDRQVIRMIRAGATQLEIATAIGKSQPAVSAMVRRMRAEGKLS